ncbi:MAG: hypothetical protein RL134_1064 [Actinomycetota bacterium]
MSTMERVPAPWTLQPLSRGIRRDSFDCGEALINQWWHEHAGQAHRRDSARTYVAVDRKGRVLGFFASTVAQLTVDEGRAVGLRDRYPIPAVRLAQLGVDRRHQGHGLGGALLAEAIRLAHDILQRAAFQVFVVEALHESAAAFYAGFGFQRFRDDPLRLYLTAGQIRASVRESDSP